MGAHSPIATHGNHDPHQSSIRRFNYERMLQRKEQEKCRKIYDKKYGVADGDRTRDNRNHNPGLYQLSYSHRRRTRGLVRPAGFEPATTRLEGGCSIQLSYGRITGIKTLAGSRKVVGVEGFEPPTFCTQNRRATGLRYTPNKT
jgi:hypothetical protein